MNPDPTPDYDRALLQRTIELRQPLARASRLAAGEGAMLLIFGSLSLLISAISFNALGSLLGVLLIGVGWWERREAPRMAAGELDAPRNLARAELVLLGGIVIYALIQLVKSQVGESELVAELESVGDLGIDVAGLSRSISMVVYVTVILVTVLYQGGMARYFAGKRGAAEAYQRESPEWAREMARGLG